MSDPVARSEESRVKRVFVHTFGCQMNVYDSRRMIQVLAGSGTAAPANGEAWVETDRPEDADLILINTCSVREKPQVKVRSALGRYALLRRQNPDLLIGIAGCVAAQEKERLLRGAIRPDLVLGPDAIGELPALVARAREERGVLRTDEFPVEDYDFVELQPLGDEGVTAMVTAMKGCDNYCSYCIVPYVRGREVSKPADQVVREVERLVAAGVCEVLLLGQNVNRYGLDLPGGAPDFAALLRRVGAIPGLDRLRFTTSHPRDCSDDLVRCFGEVGPLCEYFHLPVQAGSDAVLARMNRGYTRAQYLDLVRRLRERCPEMHLSTDVIVGFPGETDDDFQQTLDLLETVRFGSLFSFRYSPRPGTAAARERDDVPPETKQARLEAVQAAQVRRSDEVLAGHVGRTVEVLLEGASRTARQANAGPSGAVRQLTGRTRTNFIVNVDVPGADEPAAWVGRLVQVHVERARHHSLAGRVVALADRPVAPGDAVAGELRGREEDRR